MSKDMHFLETRKLLEHYSRARTFKTLYPDTISLQFSRLLITF